MRSTDTEKIEMKLILVFPYRWPDYLMILQLLQAENIKSMWKQRVRKMIVHFDQKYRFTNTDKTLPDNHSIYPEEGPVQYIFDDMKSAGRL